MASIFPLGRMCLISPSQDIYHLLEKSTRPPLHRVSQHEQRMYWSGVSCCTVSMCSQYWTGDDQWHSAKVNVASKYNPSLNKKPPSSGEHSSEELAGLYVPSAGLSCSLHTFFFTLAAFDIDTIMSLTRESFRAVEQHTTKTSQNVRITDKKTFSLLVARVEVCHSFVISSVLPKMVMLNKIIWGKMSRNVIYPLFFMHKLFIDTQTARW